jgi:hypothetical protein
MNASEHKSNSKISFNITINKLLTHKLKEKSFIFV